MNVTTATNRMNEHTVTVDEVFTALENEIVIKATCGDTRKKLSYKPQTQVFTVCHIVDEEPWVWHAFYRSSEAVECYNKIEA